MLSSPPYCSPESPSPSPDLFPRSDSLMGCTSSTGKRKRDISPFSYQSNNNVEVEGKWSLLLEKINKQTHEFYPSALLRKESSSVDGASQTDFVDDDWKLLNIACRLDRHREAEFKLHYAEVHENLGKIEAQWKRIRLQQQNIAYKEAVVLEKELWCSSQKEKLQQWKNELQEWKDTRQTQWNAYVDEHCARFKAWKEDQIQQLSVSGRVTMCWLCNTNNISKIYIPCGHSICESCSITWLANGGQHRCAHCNNNSTLYRIHHP